MMWHPHISKVVVLQIALTKFGAACRGYFEQHSGSQVQILALVINDEVAQLVEQESKRDHG